MKRFVLFLLMLALLMPTVAMAEQLSLTTGLPTDQPYNAFAVQFDNTVAARPQLNMSYADVIYEMPIVSGNDTRYTAIFNDNIPKVVEAVRSARKMHVDVSFDWSATFVHFGGQQMAGSSVYDYFEQTGLNRFDGLTDGTNFYRDNNRKAPYNAVGKLQQMAEKTDAPAADAIHTPLVFSAENPTIKGEDVNVFRIKYNGSFHPSYQYEADTGLYRRYYNKNEFKDGATGESFEVANVIVMYADYSFYNNESDRPLVELLNTTNKCEYFIGGKHFVGTWSRGGVNESTVYYDDEGNVVNFKPGKTFIQVVKTGMTVEIVE